VRRTAQIEFLSSAVMREGIAAAPGAFPPEWADRLREDFDAAFDAARATEGGLVDRGPNRWYFAVHPERLRGFLDLTTHPLVRGLSESVLGPGFHYVKVGFDVPAPGAVDQPWHRDFPAPGTPSLTSLAFNVNTVDVEPDMGPLEIAAGTHRDDGRDFIDGISRRRTSGPGTRRWPPAVIPGAATSPPTAGWPSTAAPRTRRDGAGPCSSSAPRRRPPRPRCTRSR
jgi:phytanoyl-CoA dioxygenase PhyH